MKKITIFVEGQTELLFVEKLIEEIANKNEVYIHSDKLQNGKMKNIKRLEFENIDKTAKYYTQIIDCSNDNKVQSCIFDYCINMQNKGFDKVLGLRDLYPRMFEDLEKIKKLSEVKNPELKITAKSIISVFEIETWFLSEYNLFEKRDSRLTLEFIKNLGYDLKNDKLDKDYKYHCSSKVLQKILSSVNKGYTKREKHVNKILENMDFEFLYLESRYRLESLNEFISELDDFFTGV